MNETELWYFDCKRCNRPITVAFTSLFNDDIAVGPTLSR
jgi:hypothetical protein